MGKGYMNSSLFLVRKGGYGDEDEMSLFFDREDAVKYAQERHAEAVELEWFEFSGSDYGYRVVDAWPAGGKEAE